mgnify:CR=1 FL=1
MKRFSTILKYLKDQKRYVLLYFAFNLLSVLFSLVSLGMLIPFLQLLFGHGKIADHAPKITFSAGSVMEYINYTLGIMIRDHGAAYALGAICIIIITSVFLKNLFL